MRMIVIAGMMVLAGCVAQPVQQQSSVTASLRGSLVELHQKGLGFMQSIDDSKQIDGPTRQCLTKMLVDTMTDQEIADYVSVPPKNSELVKIYLRVVPIATDNCRR